MIKIINIFAICFMFVLQVEAVDFSVASYNCGGLSDHYDYMRAASMHKLMQERYNAEPTQMAEMERIQQLALKILFAKTSEERQEAKSLWDRKNYQQLLIQLNQSPLDVDSPNTVWYEKGENALTSYEIRPVVLSDSEVEEMLQEHLAGRTMEEGRQVMAEHIFSHQLKYDLICLQEATYLDAAMFPEQYEVAFDENEHSINGVAWVKERFELIEELDANESRGFAVKLLEKLSGKTVIVASGHLTGCNPFKGGSDSKKGDQELTGILKLFEDQEADIKIIAMDSNVTATHPRLKIVKDFGYQLDYENYIENTCTNPYLILNTRLDWIAVKGEEIAINNIPVLGVGLNSIQTNVSDHKPVAAKISY